jgi:hypothetical protein
MVNNLISYQQMSALAPLKLNAPPFRLPASLRILPISGVFRPANTHFPTLAFSATSTLRAKERKPIPRSINNFRTLLLFVGGRGSATWRYLQLYLKSAQKSCLLNRLEDKFFNRATFRLSSESLRSPAPSAYHLVYSLRRFNTLAGADSGWPLGHTS